MVVLGVIGAYLLVGVITIFDISRENNYRIVYILVSSIFFIAGLTISILQVIGKAPVSPAKVIESIIKSVM